MQPAVLIDQNDQQLFENEHPKVNSDNIPEERRMFQEKIPARVLSVLPNFSGDLEQWPAWIAENTLVNLQRLQKVSCTKRKEMISAELIYLENLPEIINLFKRHFGRPEIIIKNIITSVKIMCPLTKYY